MQGPTYLINSTGLKLNALNSRWALLRRRLRCQGACHLRVCPERLLQTLTITRLLGNSDNAVRIEIAVALIAFVLLRMA